MSGQDASRGFIYQAFASIIEALTQDNWDGISVEFATSNDKVDIALLNEGRVRTCVQVKSSINLFQTTAIKGWLAALIEDCDAPLYKIFLIGLCESQAQDFMNAIGHYYSNGGGFTTEKDRVAVQGFDESKLRGHTVEFRIYPFDEEMLIAQIRDKMNRYIDVLGYQVSPPALDMICRATFYSQMLLSTSGKTLSRDKFSGEIVDWIMLTGKSGIRRNDSFATHAVGIYDPVERALVQTSKGFSPLDFPWVQACLDNCQKKCVGLIDIIKDMNMDDYEERGTEEREQKIPLYKIQFPIIKPAKFSDDECSHIIETVERICEIKLSKDFFNVGNLKVKQTLMGASEYIGSPKEREKYDHLLELSFALNDYHLYEMLLHSFDEWVFLPLAISNVSDISDSDITVTILVDQSKVQLCDPMICCKEIACLSDAICQEELIEKFFSLKETPDISKPKDRTAVFFPPQPSLDIGPSGFRQRYGEDNLLYELSWHFANRVSEDGGSYVIQYRTEQVRAREKQWLGAVLVISKPLDDLVIPYRLLSANSNGTVRGEIIITGMRDEERDSV